MNFLFFLFLTTRLLLCILKMGKRKSRLTAKTGDKSLYKNRSNTDNAVVKNKISDEDDMFDEVDAYHNQMEAKFDGDFVKLDGGDTSSEEDDGIVHGREQVLDLGITGSSDEEVEYDKDDDTEEKEGSDDSDGSTSDAESDDDSSSTDLDNENENALGSILDWGGKKRGYYGGDNGALDATSQDVEDAILEEQAAKEVQQARYSAMSEDDFFESFPVGHKESAAGKLEDPNKLNYFESSPSITLFDEHDSTVERIIPSKNIAGLSFEEKIRLLSIQSPEMLPLIQHFKTNAVEPFRDNILVVAEQLLARPNQSSSVGTTPQGMQYLRHKQMLLVSTMINVCMYLLLKTEQESSLTIKDHPVILRLNQFQGLADKLRLQVEEPFQLHEQLDTLSKAAALMTNGEADSDSSEEDDSEMEEDDSADRVQGLNDDADVSTEEEDSEILTSDNDWDGGGDTTNAERNALIEARFAVRAQDIDNSASRGIRRLLSDAAEFGDEEIEEQDLRRATKKLSSALNTISQKEKTRLKKLGQNSSGDLENEIERREDEKLQSGIDLMEKMLGKASDEENDSIDDYELDNDDDDFYEDIRKKTKAKKDLKKSTYEVLPKYPGLEDELEGERAVSRMIMKNRGLVPHKPKINRNPRVKKREQYRKAVIRRKGAVREVRTEEADRYGGELTGIKTSLSRSRKLGVR